MSIAKKIFLLLTVACASFEADAGDLPTAVPKQFFAQGSHLHDGYWTFAKTDTHRQYCMFTPGSKSVDWVKLEKESPSEAKWEREEESFSTSFRITTVTATDGGDDCFVAGVTDQNSTIIERWKFAVRSGGRKARSANARAAIGISMPRFDGDVLIRGGTYRRVSSSNRLNPTRSTLYIGTTIQPPVAMECDPEGRVLLTLEDSGTLSMIDLTADPIPPPVPLHTSSTITSLADADELAFLNHPTDPAKPLRVHCYGLDGEHSYIMFKDSNNDAVFDTHDVLTEAEYGQQYGATNWQPWY